MPSWKKVIVSGSSAHLNQITGSGGVLLQDQVRLNFGDANDLKIYHSGTHSIIQDTGTGNLEIKASIVKLRGTAGGDSMGVFTEDGGVELYYDNSKKLDVVTGGVTVTGTLAATTLTGAHANADSAVQPADTFYIGTTSIAHNRGSGGLTLAGLTLTTPNLGTPSTLVGTNISGTASNLTVGATTGVEAGADVTDTTNVTAAGAVMDSEVTNLAFVKALTKGISDGNVLTANDVVADNDFLRIDGTEVEGLTVAEVLSALSVESGATADQSNAEIVAAVEAGTDSNTFTDADHTHLNAIEASADVTDATNVTAAGAVMDSEVTDLDGIKSLTVPNSTTISTFGASLVDDAAASNARTTLGLGTSAVLSTAAIANSGTGVATADQIHTFVTTQTDEIDAGTSGNAATATLASTVTVSDSTANTNFPITLHNESNALLDDTGAFTYNPSTGTLKVENIDVAGTQTFISASSLVVTSSVIFEGTTSDGHETTLTVVDPTADRTITLKNADGTVAFTSDITGTNSNTNTGDQLVFKTVVSDSGTATADTITDALSILGGTGVTTAVSADVVTITNSGVTSNVAGSGIDVSGATGAVTISIGTGEVVNAMIGDNEVNSEHYAAGSIDHEHLANDIIDGDNIQDDVINSEHYAAASIDNEHLADDAVNSDEIASGAVDDDHLSDGVASGLAGAGMTATSGVLNVIGGTGITANANEITTTDGDIVHDNLSGFVANEHIDHTSVSITAGAGLTGGGTIASTRDIAVGAGTGVTVNANDVAIGQAVGTGDDVTFGTVRVDDATVASSKTTGALIVDGGVGVGLDIHAGGDVVAYASSDERLKDNIEVIENSLDKIGEIRGVTFDWNEESPEWAKERGRDVGVIAQEVRKVLPEIVVERTNGYLGVDYKRIIPLLIESIKELKQEVEDLKKKVN